MKRNERICPHKFRMSQSEKPNEKDAIVLEGCSIRKFVALLFVLVCLTQASGRKLISINLHTKMDDLVKQERGKNRFFGDVEVDDRDSLYAINPRQQMLSNLWCWSKVDSYPVCRTMVILNGDSLEVRPIRTPKDNYETFMDVNDQQIIELMTAKKDVINEILLVKDQETDRGWAVFETMFFAMPAFLASALVEALYSTATNKGYDWSRVGIMTGVSSGVYCGYRVLTYDTNPTSIKLSIKVVRF